MKCLFDSGDNTQENHISISYQGPEMQGGHFCVPRQVGSTSEPIGKQKY